MKSVILLTAAALSAAPAAAQDGHRFFVGLGAGAGSVSRGANGGSDVSPTIGVMAGMRVGAATALLLDVTRFGTMDDEPRTTDITPNGTVLREPDIFETTSVQLGLQMPLGGGFYLRPSLGMARHAFASYRVGQSTVELAEVSHEWGPAAGAALGRDFRAGGVAIGLEGLGMWSGGEDSSADRTIFALRVLPRFGL